MGQARRSERLKRFGAAMKSTGEIAGLWARRQLSKDGAWLDNPYCFEHVYQAAIVVLEAHRPPGKIVKPKQKIAQIVSDDLERSKAMAAHFEQHMGRMIGEQNVREAREAKQGGENE